MTGRAGRTMAEALRKVPFVVSFASVLDESAAHADVILPASTFLEMWGDDFMEGTGYAGVSLRQPVVEPVHDTRDPGDVLLQSGRSPGWAAGAGAAVARLQDAGRLPPDRRSTWSAAKLRGERRLVGAGLLQCRSRAARPGRRWSAATG